MKHHNIVISTAIAALTSGSLLAATAVSAGAPVCAEQERCYGISKSGKNDCSTASSACSGTAKQDNQKDAWIYVPKGTCLKVAGGSLAAADLKKK
jgi:uncharacterized membrane protein